MVTKEDALTENEFHLGTCSSITGPRGGVTIRRYVARRNGKTKTWKRQPEKFQVPYRYGLYEHGYITSWSDAHCEKDCPLNREEESHD